MGTRRLRVNFELNANNCFEIEREDRGHEVKSDEIVCTEDQSKPTHSFGFQSSGLETEKQEQTVPFYHQLLYNRLV